MYDATHRRLANGAPRIHCITETGLATSLVIHRNAQFYAAANHMAHAPAPHEVGV